MKNKRIGVLGCSEGLGKFLVDDGFIGISRYDPIPKGLDVVVMCSVAPATSSESLIERNLSVAHKVVDSSPKQVIFTSSVDAANLATEYGAMKRQLEMFFDDQSNAICCSSIRLGFLVGPNRRSNHLKKILLNTDLTLSAESTFDYVSYQSVRLVIEKSEEIGHGIFYLTPIDKAVPLSELALKLGFSACFGGFKYLAEKDEAFGNLNKLVTEYRMTQYGEIFRGLGEGIDIRREWLSRQKFS